jgi:quercetin dioxygenase-like cupin family protein
MSFQLFHSRGDPVNKTIAVGATAALLLFAVPAGAKDVPPKGAPKAVLTPTADNKWAEVPGMAGVQMAVAQGDPSKGPSHFFIKFAPGFSAPLHHHTANHYVVVLAGTVVLNVDGAATKLPAGSYFSFTGMKPHATSCDASAECLLAIDSRGKWDVVPEQAAKDESKKD